MIRLKWILDINLYLFCFYIQFYFVRHLLCGKELRKLYQTIHVIDTWRESQLIYPPPELRARVGSVFFVWFFKERNTRAEWARTSVCKLTQMQQSAKNHRFCTMGLWPPVVSHDGIELTRDYGLKDGLKDCLEASRGLF